MSLANYQLEPNPAARGAQGLIYFGVRLEDGAATAIKVAIPGPQAAAALNQEVAVLRALQEERVRGVVPIWEAFEWDGRPAMSMPQFPRHMGDWLNETLSSPHQDSLVQTLQYTSKLAYVLGQIHRTRIGDGTLVHRDVKPENVFLDANGAPFLGDFGGAMAIGGLKRVELALFGTPMWAPLDQLLPGQAIPDPTWDTYALCVMLYAAITGARPAYHAEPTSLLTPTGRELWEVGKKAVEAPPEERAHWHKAFARMRVGTHAGDLVDVTGHSALVTGDRQALEAGIARLGQLAGLDQASQRFISRGLWNILVRGLSPLSHPSPPNRFRDGLELGELLDELREKATPKSVVKTAPQPVSAPKAPSRVQLSGEFTVPPRTTLSEGSPWAIRVVAIIGVGVLSGAAYAGWDTINVVLGELLTKPPRVEVPPGDVVMDGGKVVSVGGFQLDRTEVTGAQWQLCVTEDACSADHYVRLAEHYPVIGLKLTDASEYCEWAGGWVPTEAEWLRAAGLTPMPWGTEPATCDRAVALGCAPDVQPADTTPMGQTPFGAVDLAGNAWEWTQTQTGGVLRGGGVLSPVSELGKMGRLAIPENGTHTHASVRCAYPID
ncbi:MAG: SUMF1/EgtB/PvdO family nonheme iron enzyme [Rhodobacterales bacterium]|nr:SUMF1/EgtB/PvdO family nonheme iron enzyme [Rhodobacterales bacterium]